MKTEHGYQIIESYMIEPNRYLILTQRDHAISPYVVWFMNDEGKCTSGSYFPNRETASNNFNQIKEGYRCVK